MHSPAFPTAVWMEDRLNTPSASTHRTDGAKPVLFIDLDAFKQINDTLGIT